MLQEQPTVEATGKVGLRATHSALPALQPRSEHSGERVKQPYRHLYVSHNETLDRHSNVGSAAQRPGFAIRKRSGSWDYRGVPPESL